MRYWRMGEPVQNLGDYLTIGLLKHVLNGAPEPFSVIRLIGSVIDAYNIGQDLASLPPTPSPTVAFWGCGLRSEEPIPPELLRVCRFRALRGPLSARRLSVPAGTPLGDPGLLLPLFHDAPSEPSRRSLCVTHFFDERSPDVVRTHTGADEVMSARLPADEIALWAAVDRILVAGFVLTGALHAAVIRAAYGLPFAFWDSGIVDAPFKWRDFAASLGCPGPFVRDVAQGRLAYEQVMRPFLRLPPLTPLLDRAPIGVEPTVLRRARSWDASRGLTPGGGRDPTG